MASDARFSNSKMKEKRASLSSKRHSSPVVSLLSVPSSARRHKTVRVSAVIACAALVLCTLTLYFLTSGRAGTAATGTTLLSTTASSLGKSPSKIDAPIAREEGHEEREGEREADKVGELTEMTKESVSLGDEKKEGEEEGEEKIDPLLYNQALSHAAFHSIVVQQALADVVTEGKSEKKGIVVIGVEWGKDVMHFAHAGFHVLAMEPMPRFHDMLASRLAQEPTWNVTLVRAAAGNASGTMRLRYQGVEAPDVVQVLPIDDVVQSQHDVSLQTAHQLLDPQVHQQLDQSIVTRHHAPNLDQQLKILTADVQGGELSVLQGARKLIDDSIDMIWVEAIACNPDLPTLLRFFHERGFAVFDFVPVGTPLTQEKSNTSWRSRHNFLFPPERPSAFNEYLNWFCASRHQGFTILQTDFVAIKRHLVPAARRHLAGIAERVCSLQGVLCVLRGLLKEEGARVGAGVGKR